MSAAGSSGQDERSSLSWHLYLIPLNVAIGSSGILTTLIALSFGASVADIGVMTAAGAAASIIFSTLWGRLSDLSGTRRNYLIFLFVALGPVFVVMSVATLVPQLILLYTLLSVFTSGITPIAVMYSVENRKAKNWQGEVARYNSLSSLGAILGLAVNTVVALFLRTAWLFYISTAMCFLSAIMLWKSGREPEITLERHFFHVGLHDVERFLSPRPIFLQLQRVRRLRIPKTLGKFKPLQLLFLASLVHWIGIFFFSVGQIPLMKDLGLSDSMMLAVNVAANAAAAVSFIKIAPRLKLDQQRTLNIAVLSRGFLILCWVLPIFLIFPVPFVFLFLLTLSIVFNVFYAVIWLAVTNFAVSQAPADRKGATQGELLSVIGLANAVGSALGGVALASFGYAIGFVIAAVISVLAVPLISKMNVI